MRRKTRKHVVNVVFFGVALFFVIYLNRHQSSNKTFAWTAIRYKTTSPTLPKARGICPGLADAWKPVLVVARVEADGDPKWVDALARLYHICVYTADALVDTDSTNLQVPENRGHEAMAYLTFIIDNYADVPAAGAVFVHGSRWAWHNDDPNYDNAALLATLNISAALAPSGYHNLRCDWSTSMCPPSTPPQGSLEVSASAMLEPWNARAVSDAALPRAFATLFGGDVDGYSSSRDRTVLLGRTDTVRAQCCAQFVVARDSMWQHSRDEYIALRQWLLDGSRGSDKSEHSQMGDAAPSDDRIAGRILSYLWHILFLKQGKFTGGVDLEQLNRLACPSAEECYCRLYGRCGLEGCDSLGQCYGQYTLPPDLRLPDDWAASHA